jgi:hypothetical protein
MKRVDVDADGANYTALRLQVVGGVTLNNPGPGRNTVVFGTTNIGGATGTFTQVGQHFSALRTLSNQLCNCRLRQLLWRTVCS